MFPQAVPQLRPDWIAKNGEIVNFMRFSDVLRRCGVEAADVVAVVSAAEENGEELDLLLEDLTAFLAPGLLIMPVGKNKDTAIPNGIFDPADSASGEGELSERFRKMPGVVRSLHPTGSLAVRGEGAEAFIAGHDRCISSFSAASPWWRLFQQNGKSVFIDCGLEAAGIIAAAEEWAGCARLSKRFQHRRLLLANGRRRRVKIKVHTGKHYLNYPKVEEDLQKLGFLSKLNWGTHMVTVMDVSGSVDFILQLLRRKKRFFAARRKGVYLKKS